MAADAAFWRAKRVLVTGGAGFLGSGLCHALLALGAEPVALDAMVENTGANAANVEGVPLAVLDLRHDDLREACAGVDVVLHCAAQISHAGSMADPLADLAHNATGTLRLLLALRAHAPAARLVIASTRQLYGRPRALPVDEAHPIAPPDANAISKWAAEQYALLEHRIHGRHVAALRLTNCYGPRLRVKDHRQTFLGIWIRRVLEGEAFEVWGGAQTRDLAYLDDVVAAFLLAAEHASCAGRVFNIGGAPPVSLRDLADALCAAAGGGRYTLLDFPADRAAIDIGSYAADDGAFRSATGWAPSVPLGDGLQRTLDWLRPRLPLYV
jgi:nucleoside-diphosphate-sugar epimerase